MGILDFLKPIGTGNKLFPKLDKQVGSFFGGSPDKLKNIPTLTPEQQDVHNSILNQLMQSLSPGGGFSQAQQYDKNLLSGGPGQGEAYEQFSSPYMQQFKEQILPQIAEHFAGGGALSSSGFGQALGGAGAGLQSQLAQLFSSLQGQAAQRQQGQFQNLSQIGLGQQPFAYEQQAGNAGALGPLAVGLGSSLAGPLGGVLGGGISSLFKGFGQGKQSSQSMPGLSGFGIPNFMNR